MNTKYFAYGRTVQTSVRKDNVIWFFENGEIDNKASRYFVEVLSPKEKGAFSSEDYFFFQTVHTGAFLEKGKTTKGRGIRHRFLANHIPKLDGLELDDKRIIDRKNSELEDESDWEKEVLTFRGISWLSKWLPEDARDQNGYRGAELLGILRADIDNLGFLFSSGFKKTAVEKNKEVDNVTVSRYLTFSRMVDTFFSGWVNEILSSHEEFKAIYTVYSGGDDLFIVGPWERVIKFAIHLNDKFREFTCDNKRNISLSAGIAVVKPHYPISSGAEQAKVLLELARQSGKDSIALFGTIVKWDELSPLTEFFEFLDEKLHDDHSGITFGFVNRLLRYHRMYTKVKFEGRVEDIKYLPLLNYDIGRNIIKRDREGQISNLDELEKLNILRECPPRERFMSSLKIPIFWTLYRNRK